MSDKDRPLNARGKTQAQQMGSYLSQQQIEPELIICSSARRARQTLKKALKSWQSKAEIIFEDRLYLASTGTILSLLEELGKNASHLMIIGHNPGFHTLASGLATKGQGDDLLTLSQRYPTGTLCVIKSEADKWETLDQHAAKLDMFVTPKSLASADLTNN